ncbi:hypothetical protein T440DRAFT_43127 [Plenodomus tracheiphilus IPT5]|uniref:Uncharacterized protein n=1 Tax=Plenodomus tracheiphilus IPT5 TaxID=1408161 RepID=A0A6A7BA54_9PLEO|nr:hypothetical protein T440DRAFT_43127 [Plenodomus tracheiphilus IPT5]
MRRPSPASMVRTSLLCTYTAHRTQYSEYTWAQVVGDRQRAPRPARTLTSTPTAAGLTSTSRAPAALNQAVKRPWISETCGRPSNRATGRAVSSGARTLTSAHPAHPAHANKDRRSAHHWRRPPVWRQAFEEKPQWPTDTHPSEHFEGAAHASDMVTSRHAEIGQGPLLLPYPYQGIHMRAVTADGRVWQCCEFCDLDCWWVALSLALPWRMHPSNR